MDLLDILNGHTNEVFTGTYMKALPQGGANDDAPVVFDYEHVDPTSWTYRRLYGAMTSVDAATTAIKSCDPIEWKPGAFVRLQDGRTYVITAARRDYQSKQAYRYLDKIAGADTVISLAQVEDLYK